MKEIKLEIPEGKCVKWVNGVLTLFDETDNRPVTERIKTFEDACNALGDENQFVKEYWNNAEIGTISSDILAYLRLRIITAALNEGWEPQFIEGEKRYYPWFSIRNGLAYERAFNASSSSYSGLRLAFKTLELASYAGDQFIKEWADFLSSTPLK